MSNYEQRYYAYPEGQKNVNDSDIDDPKYIPSVSLPNKDLYNAQMTLQNTKAINSIQEKINRLKSNEDANNRNLRQMENDIYALQNELAKANKIILEKEKMIREFHSVVELSKKKFTKMEDANLNLKTAINNFQRQISELNQELKKQKLKNEQNESNSKSAYYYQEHINDLQNQFASKETKLNLQYQEKESKMKMEFNNEISKLTKELDASKTENQRLKTQISNLQINIEKLNVQLEEITTNANDDKEKKEKELAQCYQKISELEYKLKEKESNIKEQFLTMDTQNQSMKEENINLIKELKDKSQKLKEVEVNVEKLSHENSIMQENAKENKFALMNKDSIISQLKNQNMQLQKELAERDAEMNEYSQTIQKDISNLNKALTTKDKEKEQLEFSNEKLRQNLSQANEQFNQMKSFLTDKATSIERVYNNEIVKNDKLEKRMKELQRHLREKERALTEENQSLRNTLAEKNLQQEQIEQQYQNEIQNLSQYSTLPNQVNHSMMAGLNSDMPRNVSYFGVRPEITNFSRYEDVEEEEQKRSLNEFRRLLNRIDEKLDLSS